MNFALPSFNKPELLHARLDHLSLDYHLSVCASVSRTPADVAITTATKASGSGSPRQQQPILTRCLKQHRGTPHGQGTRACWRGDDRKHTVKRFVCYNRPKCSKNWTAVSVQADRTMNGGRRPGEGLRLGFAL